jgi:hypothetical protein
VHPKFPPMKSSKDPRSAEPGPTLAATVAALAARLKATSTHTGRAAQDADEAARALARSDREHERRLSRLMPPRVQREFEAQKARWRKRLASLAGDNGRAAVSDLARMRGEARASLESFLRASKVDVAALRRAIKDRNTARAAALRAALKSPSTPAPR